MSHFDSTTKGSSSKMNTSNFVTIDQPSTIETTSTTNCCNNHNPFMADNSSSLGSSSNNNNNNNINMLNQLPPQVQKPQLSSPGYHHPLKPSISNLSSSNLKTGDFTGHRPIMQSNVNPTAVSTSVSTSKTSGNHVTASSTAAFKITQVGPVVGSNVVVSRMDSLRPTSASPVPTSGPLANNNNNSTNIYNAAANRVTFTQRPPSTTNSSNSSTQSQTILQSNIKPSPYPPTSGTSTHTNFYHPTQTNVTKFTNMTVAGVGSKNPLKPTHYTVPNSTHSASASSASSNNTSIPSTHPNTNLSGPNTSGAQPPKTTLKASDLIHILPNLFNTLKRRNSQSGGSISSTIAGMSQSSLAAAVAAAAANHSNFGKPLTTSSAAALVAEQLLSVASAPLSDESSSSPPPYSSSNSSHSPSSMMSKRLKMYSSADAHQCEVCGKTYKHRNCLSKHRWEHHESWEHTKKVCQTKHQQVQLLEAAQVLAEIVLGVQPDRKQLHQDQYNNGVYNDYDNDDNNSNSNEDSESSSNEDDAVIDSFNSNSNTNLITGNHQNIHNQDQEGDMEENVSVGEHEFEAIPAV